MQRMGDYRVGCTYHTSPPIVGVFMEERIQKPQVVDNIKETVFQTQGSCTYEPTGIVKASAMPVQAQTGQ